MNYIYGEMSKDILPTELDLLYGTSLTIPEAIPLTALKCENPEKLRIEGEYTQLYELELTTRDAVAKYPYFAYPLKYGELKHINNGVFDVITNWKYIVVQYNKINYYLYYYTNKLAPGRQTTFTFKLK